MKTYIVTVAVDGKAFCEVQAESEEDAIEKSHLADWQIDEWDRNTDASRGGYIYAEEE